MTNPKTTKDGIEPTEQSHYEEATPETAIRPDPNDGRSYKELLDALRATVIGLYYLLPANGEPYERMCIGISAINQLENYHGRT